MSKKLKAYISTTLLMEIFGLIINWFMVKEEFRGAPLHLCLIWFNVMVTPVLSLIILFTYPEE